MFPTTPLLDTFTRTEDPITGWTNGSPFSGLTAFAANGTQMVAGGTFREGYWNAESFDADQEAWVTVVTQPDGGQGHIFVRMTGTDDTADCYMLSFQGDEAGPGPYLEKSINGSLTTLTSFSTTLSDGDKLGIRVVRNQISCWRDSGSGWVQMGTTIADSDITGAGSIGIYTGNTTTHPVFDDFGGGAAVLPGRTYRRLVGPRQLPTSAEDLYTTPAGTRARVRHLHVSNPSPSDVDVTLEIASPLQFVGAGSGAERLTTGTVSVSKTGCTAGNLVIFQNFFGGDTGDGGFTNFSNVEGLDGTDGVLTSLINAANRQVLLGRVIADGTVSGDLVVGASGDDAVGRIYEFSGVSMGTTLATVCENDAYSGQNSETGFTTSTTVTDADVITLGDDRLALNFVGVRSANTIGPFTGETGGNWAEAIAEYSGTTLTIQLQTAEIASAGTIDGGSVTITSAYWITIGTAIIPASDASTRILDAYPIPAASIYSTRVRAEYTLEPGEKIQGWAAPSAPGFPATALLDDFNRANEDPIATGWTAPLVAGDGSARLISNQFSPSAAGNWSGAYWDIATFGPDCEAYATVAALPETNGYANVWARIQNGGGSATGYIVQYLHRLPDPGIVYIQSTGTGGTLLLISDVTLSAGDKLGIRCIGDRIEAWRTSGGVWTLLGSAIDGQYASAGNIGLELNGSSGRLDDFGGGNVSAYAAEVLADEPVAYYRMNEPSGQPQDSSGNGNHTTVTGGTPTYGAAGALSSDPESAAIQLVAASTEYFTAPDDDSLDLGDTFTIEAWVKRARVGFDDPLVSKSTGAYVVAFDTTTHRFQLNRYGSGTIAESTVAITADGLWHHLVATKSGATAKIYVDGVDVTNSVGSHTCTDTTDPLSLGANTGASQTLDGTLDEVAIYPTALSAERVKAHYDASQLPVIVVDGVTESI